MHQQPHDWSSQTSQSYTSSSYPSSTSASTMHSYSSYAQPAPGSSHGYGSNGYPSSYYQSLISSPPSAGHTPSLNNQLMPLAGLPSAPQPAYGSQPTPPYAQTQPQDSTGQVAPAGHKPKVTATLWEDEGTICFQVECDGLCVARRDDNSFINGTKLLNVAGMTRGRRDGILKSEKTRQVVKIGPMHLKGVWIPFDRALDFANREKITEKLYPLFVHNINNLLPQGQLHRNSQTMQNRSKIGMGGPPNPMVAPLTQHPSMQLPSQIAANQRPSIDRAHTFPAPPTPTSASSVMNQSAEYWSSSNLNGISQSGQNSLGLENSMTNTRSMPSTPASTPPNNSLQSLTGFHSQGLGSSSQAHNQYASQYGSSNPYIKNEMGPPSRSGTLPGSDSKEVKPDPFTAAQPSADSGATDNGGSYSQESSSLGSSHGAFNYSGLPNVHMISNHNDATDQVGSSAHHDSTTGQITPRTSIGHDHWTGYQTPPRTSSNYPSSLISGSNKRSRDDEESEFKLTGDLDNLKRHKSGRDDILGPRPGIMQHVGR